MAENRKYQKTLGACYLGFVTIWDLSPSQSLPTLLPFCF